MDVETNALHLKDGKGNELVYELGESGEIISLIDSGGQRYGALFDAVGVRELVNPDGTKLLVDYGIDGHVSGLTNPDQSKIAFAYDSEDNLVSCQKLYTAYFSAHCIIYVVYYTVCLCMAVQRMHGQSYPVPFTQTFNDLYLHIHLFVCADIQSC